MAGDEHDDILRRIAREAEVSPRKQRTTVARLDEVSQRGHQVRAIVFFRIESIRVGLCQFEMHFGAVRSECCCFLFNFLLF